MQIWKRCKRAWNAVSFNEIAGIATLVGLFLSSATIQWGIANPNVKTLAELLNTIFMWITIPATMLWVIGVFRRGRLQRNPFCTTFSDYCDLCDEMLQLPTDDKGLYTIQTPITFDKRAPKQITAFNNYIDSTVRFLVKTETAYRRIIVLYNDTEEPKRHAVEFATKLLQKASDTKRENPSKSVTLANVHLGFLHESEFPTRFLARLDVHSISKNICSIAFSHVKSGKEGLGGSNWWEFAGSIYVHESAGDMAKTLRDDLTALWEHLERKGQVFCYNDDFLTQSNHGAAGVTREIETLVSKAISNACPCPLTIRDIPRFVERLRVEPDLLGMLCAECTSSLTAAPASP